MREQASAQSEWLPGRLAANGLQIDPQRSGSFFDRMVETTFSTAGFRLFRCLPTPASLLPSTVIIDEQMSHVISAERVRRAENIKDVCADKGYHRAQTLREIDKRGIRTYIPERDQKGNRRFTDKGGWSTSRAFHKNRARVRRPKGKALQRKRGELIERSFAHICETGGHRRVRLRGRGNILKRYLIQTAGFNLGVVLRKLIGRGTPRGFAEARNRLEAAVFVVWAVLRAVGAAATSRRWWPRPQPARITGRPRGPRRRAPARGSTARSIAQACAGLRARSLGIEVRSRSPVEEP